MIEYLPIILPLLLTYILVGVSLVLHSIPYIRDYNIFLNKIAPDKEDDLKHIEELYLNEINNSCLSAYTNTDDRIFFLVQTVFFPVFFVMYVVIAWND